MSEKISPATRLIVEARAAEIVETFCTSLEQTPPWSTMLGNGILPRDESTKRLLEEVKGDGFHAMLVEVDDKIVAASIYRTYTQEALKKADSSMLDPFLADFLGDVIDQTGITTAVYLERTFVHPSFQGKGIATRLRQTVIDQLKEEYPSGFIVSTTHRSDNPAIIANSRSLGFQ